MPKYILLGKAQCQGEGFMVLDFTGLDPNPLNRKLLNPTTENLNLNPKPLNPKPYNP